MPTIEEILAKQARGETLTAEEQEQIKNADNGGDDENLTPEQLKAQRIEMQKRIKELNRESAERRKKIEAFEKAEQDRKNAELTDLEKAKKQLSDQSPELERLRKENQQFKLRQEFDKTCRTLKIEFANDTAQDDAFEKLDIETVGEDYAGMKDAITALQKSRPHWFGKVQPQPTDAKNKGKTNGEITAAEIVDRKRSQYGAL